MVVMTLRRWVSFGRHGQALTVSAVMICAIPERGTLDGSIGFGDCFDVRNDR